MTVEKAPDAFRNISEVAGLLDVPAHVLRFWETRFTQIKPIKRSGGRRYYRPTDIALLKRIRALLYEHGYTIKGAQQVLRSNGGGRGDAVPVAVADGGNGEGSVVAAAMPMPDAPANSDLVRAVQLLHEASERLDKL